MTHTAHTAHAMQTVDVREIAPRDRHPLIFSAFRGLPTGQSMQLVNDHDPLPLYYQFQAEMPGGIVWEYLEAGPDTWRVSITKSAETPSQSGCCGSCGGR